MKISELMVRYVDLHAVTKKSFRKDVYRINKYLTPCLGHLELEELNGLAVREWHLYLTQQSGLYMANRCLEILRKAFNLAQDWDLFELRNPCARVKAHKEKKRKRYLSALEIQRLLEALTLESHPVATAIKLYLLTGLRKSELISATWNNLDVDQAILTIPDTKNGEPFDCPLTPAALELLLCLPQISDKIFPGERRGTTLDIDRAWLRIRTRAGIEDVRIHDLRRTVGSWLANAGESLLTIGKVLNHRDSQSSAAYAHLQTDSQRRALNRLADAIMPEPRNPALEPAAPPESCDPLLPSGVTRH